MTLTKEERDEWRERMTDKKWCGSVEPTEFTLRLLGDLEAAEARAEQAEAERDALLAVAYCPHESCGKGKPSADECRQCIRDWARQEAQKRGEAV
jgi:hypothetical protein